MARISATNIVVSKRNRRENLFELLYQTPLTKDAISAYQGRRMTHIPGKFRLSSEHVDGGWQPRLWGGRNAVR
jgi:hypothetical protein